jgi:hypothetical protein
MTRKVAKMPKNSVGCSEIDHDQIDKILVIEVQARVSISINI